MRCGLNDFRSFSILLWPIICTAGAASDEKEATPPAAGASRTVVDDFQPASQSLRLITGDVNPADGKLSFGPGKGRAAWDIQGSPAEVIFEIDLDFSDATTADPSPVVAGFPTDRSQLVAVSLSAKVTRTMRPSRSAC